MDICSFCGRPRNEVKALTSSVFQTGTNICNRCLTELGAKPQRVDSKKEPRPLQKPRELKATLDLHVISQEDAKKDIAVAVYNHYKRRRAHGTGDVELSKSNILLMGPSGCGKTEIVRSIAKALGVPLHVGDATKLTMTGYVGDDVESLLQGLVTAASGDLEAAQWGIVFLDEADKLARKSGRGVSGHRDVTGEGVQQALLKLVEGSKCNLPKTVKDGVLQNSEVLNTDNILFIFTGSFAGIEEIVKSRISKDSRIGFGSAQKAKEVTLATSYREVTEEDLLEFGIIPELLGRLPVRTAVYPLTEDEMVRILTEPKNALVKQYVALFEMDGITLEFDEEAIRYVGKKASESVTGARSLRGILEKALKPYAYECPDQTDIRSIRITRAVIEEGAPAVITREVAKEGAA